MRYIMIMIVLAMLASCSSIGNVAKYTVCFGQEPEECIQDYATISGLMLHKGVK